MSDAGEAAPVTVFRTRDGEACREHALVLAALGIEHAMGVDEGWQVIVVAARDAARARDELRRFEAENSAPRSAAEEPRRLAGGADAAIPFALLLVAVWIAAVRHSLGRDWEAAGEGVAGRVLAGEWWRAVTALTLHADAAHLAGNVLFGGAFLWFTSQLAGPGVALAASLLAGALGNALNALVQPADHRSLGASTAVFGTLGVLAALGFRQQAARRQPRWKRWAPLVAGVLLLGYLGTEGVRTDVVAHVTGFAAGLAVGLLLARPLRERPPGAAWQWLLGLASLAAVWGAWLAAFRAVA